MSFSVIFKQLREEKGLSQNDVAKALNIPRSTIANYEIEGKRLPRNDRLKEIAEFFEVSLDHLLRGEERRDQGPFMDSSSPTLNQKEKELIDLFNELPSEKKELVLKGMKIMMDGMR